MDFTPLYPHSSSSSSQVSPDGVYVLASVGDRLVVRVTQSMEVIRSWRCDQLDCNNQSDTEINNSKHSQNQDRHRLVSSSSVKEQSKTYSRSNKPTIPSLGCSTTLPALAIQDDHRPPVLTSISFSPNSQYVCALFRQPSTSIVFIYSIELDKLAARIKIGAEGVASGEKAVRWSPNGNSLMVWSGWNLRITIWPLSDLQAKPVQLHHPKHGPQIGSSFSSTGRYFALICHQSGSFQDHVGIYDTINWSCVSLFRLTTELADPTHLHWSPCDRYLAIVESALLDYRVEIWTPTGFNLAYFTPRHQRLNQIDLSSDQKPNRPQNVSRINSDSSSTDHFQRKDSSRVNQQDSDTNGHTGLGIRHIKWRPDGEYLAVGGWDSKIHLLNDLTWTSICEIDLSEMHNARVLNEPREWISRTRGHGIVPCKASKTFDFQPYTRQIYFRYSIWNWYIVEVVATNVLPEPLKPDYSKPNPSMGVKEIEWSARGDFMACRNEAMPTLIFIFSFRSSNHPSTSVSSAELSQTSCVVPLRPRLSSILNFASPVRSFTWHPSLKQLVIVCATSAVYSWYPTQPGLHVPYNTQTNDYCEGIGVPAGIPFNPSSISWTPAGDMMLISDKMAFCLAFPVSEEAEHNLMRNV